MNETVTTEASPAAKFEPNKVHLEAPAQWLKEGWSDFLDAPAVSCAYGGIFVLISYIIVFGLSYVGLDHLILPMSGGFILFAPFMALGLYEVARQRELGQIPTFMTTFDAWKRAPRRLAIMAFLLLVFMLFWTRVALVIYALMMGNANLSLDALFINIFSSTDGLIFIAVGSAIGLGFAALVFLLTAVSVPMILDRQTGTFEAMVFSVQTVMKNSHVMWSWAFTIAIITWFGIITVFLGLIVAMPVLGYATWHAYKDLVPSVTQEN